MLKTLGIHHITAMVNDAQRNIDFYAGVLGLRLIKKTINFDRPEVYHLYFGNKTGQPGTVITFFPWPKQLKGRIGIGQVGLISFAIPLGSSSFWKQRLAKFKIQYEITNRFCEESITFTDPDGIPLELVERNIVSKNGWDSVIKKEYAISGFSGATLISAKPHKTADVLEKLLGLKISSDEAGFLRLNSEGELGNFIDIKLTPSVRGLMGAGTVHHLAWRAKDEAEVLKWRELLIEKGYHPTEIRDRNYFTAVYFQEEGGILFEVASDSPGFTIDEPLDTLGENLMLPSWLEDKRNELEQLLPKVEARILKEDIQ
ncbi:ring-cleaving dioxygenase [Metabacillus malikii]|uniref:Glyoxalase family protein n=1 Tax=Metabacillus malikii TaxID=1504265 RepID=A0ABT9ZHR9_9BACI|nr:ring-cleaving dioxygenase [Metabacillus malikii]MDQ0231838.1 glyoxalase family protein [Metabacillus malikii]